MSTFQLSPFVKEYIGGFSEPVSYNRNSPYPAWRIIDSNEFSYKNLKAFLSGYNLTAYYRHYSRPQEKTIQTCIEIAPTVPASIKDLLSQLCSNSSKETTDSPCVFWPIRDTKELDYELLLEKKFHEVGKLLNDYEMICYKYRDYVDPPYYPHYNSIAVINSPNKFDIVFFEELYGSLDGIYEEDVIYYLMLLDKKFGIEFIALDQIQLQEIPKGDSFLELYSIVSKLCPDVYYEGADTKELAKGKIRLYWEYDI